MSYEYFLLLIAIAFISLGVAYTNDAGKTCPYDGEKDQTVLDTLNSEEFQNKLSPFATLFLKEIPSTDFFFKLFDVSFTPAVKQRIFFNGCVYYGTKRGLKCPINLCKDVSRKVVDAFTDKFTSADYFLVVANTLESSLNRKGQLKSLNEEAICKKIKKFLSDVAQYLCVPDAKGPGDALFSLIDGGAIKYFESIGVNSKKDISFLAKSFGDQFAKVGKQIAEDAKTTKSPNLLLVEIERDPTVL